MPLNDTKAAIADQTTVRARVALLLQNIGSQVLGAAGDPGRSADLGREIAGRAAELADVIVLNTPSAGEPALPTVLRTDGSAPITETDYKARFITQFIANATPKDADDATKATVQANAEMAAADAWAAHTDAHTPEEDAEAHLLAN